MNASEEVKENHRNTQKAATTPVLTSASYTIGKPEVDVDEICTRPSRGGWVVRCSHPTAARALGSVVFMLCALTLNHGLPVDLSRRVCRYHTPGASPAGDVGAEDGADALPYLRGGGPHHPGDRLRGQAGAGEVHLQDQAADAGQPHESAHFQEEVI
eukprot:726040-Pyramimonas_sp.AAC.2